MKSRTASSDSGNAEVMKRSLKKDVKGHVHREVDTQTFIKEVWGLPAATVSTITESNLYNAPGIGPIITAYDELLSSSKDNESALHSPFRTLAATLMTSICQTLGLDLDTTITTEFWDTEGNKPLPSNLFSTSTRLRKPDMLDMFKQADDYQPKWDDVRCSFEFKKKKEKKDSRASPLDPIQRVTMWRVNCSPPSGASSSSSAVGSSHSQGLLSIHSSERTASGSTARSGSKRTHSEVSDAQATSTEKSNKRQRVVAVNNDAAQLFTYALECLATGSRHYTTGFLIVNSCVTLWYFDRTAVTSTTTFSFDTNEGLLSLGLALFALSQCTMKQAGFDPNLYKLVVPQLGELLTERSVLPLGKPSASIKEKCYMFPILGSSSDQQYIFPLVDYLYHYSGIVGRGTCVALRPSLLYVTKLFSRAYTRSR